ncbi:HNH endonuclease [Azotobacter salinestris]|uniref:HNH endonuclease n=1 Tax=Azotobacter salinestris TaxID=69964 RepID=UPI0032DFDFAF
MRIKVDFSELKHLAQQISTASADFTLKSSDSEFRPIDKELDEGLEVDIDAVEIEGGLLSYHGRQVLLYIKDHGNNFDAAVADPQKGRRFHVAHCSTLEDMRQKNRFQRFVATNRVTGLFEIEGTSGWGGSQKADVALKVCMNCLSKLNYMGSSDYQKKRKVFQEFSLQKFFSDYSSCFLYMPKSWAESTNIGYTSDWEETSKATRKKAGYICSECGIDLSNHPRLCHVHHRNGVKYDNSPENLQVLCADCHRRQPYHEGMFVRHTEMQIITHLRRQSGKLDKTDWSVAFERADPAVHGDLDHLQRKGYPPPVIGYKIQGEHGDVLAEIEAAWPEKRLGLTIGEITAPGWRLWRVGDICANP